MPGWEDKIDLTRIRQGKDDGCILSQLFDPLDDVTGFQRGVAHLGISGRVWRFGFSVPPVPRHVAEGWLYPKLEQEWRDIITYRRKQRAVSRLRRPASVNTRDWIV
jgi:hypothetical protein